MILSIFNIINKATINIHVQVFSPVGEQGFPNFCQHSQRVSPPGLCVCVCAQLKIKIMLERKIIILKTPSISIDMIILLDTSEQGI